MASAEAKYALGDRLTTRSLRPRSRPYRKAKPSDEPLPRTESSASMSQTIERDPRIAVLGVFNKVVESTIPSENLVALDPQHFNIGIFSWNQPARDLPPWVSERKHLKLRMASSGKAKSIWRLVRALREIRPDIIHVHHLPSGVWGFRLAKHLSTAKRVVTVHNRYHSYSEGQRQLFRKLFRWADMVVCNSESTRRSIETIDPGAVREDRSVVIYNGVDTAIVNRLAGRDAAATAPPAAGLVIGCVARLVPQKDHETLLRAFAIVQDRVPDAKLVLVGDGRLRPDLESLAATLEIDSHVEFRGMIPRDEVYRSLGSFTVKVVASRWEGFCNAMVEPMAAGVPVIASDIPTLREVLGPRGRFFPVGNSAALADLMMEVHTKRAAARQYGVELAERAGTEFSMQRCVAEHQVLYRRLVQGTHSRITGRDDLQTASANRYTTFQNEPSKR